jgi:hypothetical protein
METNCHTHALNYHKAGHFELKCGDMEIKYHIDEKIYYKNRPSINCTSNVKLGWIIVLLVILILRLPKGEGNVLVADYNKKPQDQYNFHTVSAVFYFSKNY